jgi:hypothetical protein
LTEPNDKDLLSALSATREQLETAIIREQQIIERYRAENRALAERYEGVRPAWVSGEMGSNSARLADAQERLRALSQQLAEGR